MRCLVSQGLSFISVAGHVLRARHRVAQDPMPLRRHLVRSHAQCSRGAAKVVIEVSARSALSSGCRCEQRLVYARQPAASNFRVAVQGRIK